MSQAEDEHCSCENMYNSFKLQGRCATIVLASFRLFLKGEAHMFAPGDINSCTVEGVFSNEMSRNIFLCRKTLLSGSASLISM